MKNKSYNIKKRLHTKAIILCVSFPYLCVFLRRGRRAILGNYVHSSHGHLWCTLSAQQYSRHLAVRGEGRREGRYRPLWVRPWRRWDKRTKKMLWEMVSRQWELPEHRLVWQGWSEWGRERGSNSGWNEKPLENGLRRWIKMILLVLKGSFWLPCWEYSLESIGAKC